MSDRKPERQSKMKWRGWHTVVALLLIGGMVWGANRMMGPAPGEGRSFQGVGGETKPILDPMGFRDRAARRAYMAAQQFPEVLDEVFCYCGCDRAPVNHKSLLSCFTDQHGAT